MYSSFGFTELQVLLVDIPRSSADLPSELLHLSLT